MAPSPLNSEFETRLVNRKCRLPPFRSPIVNSSIVRINIGSDLSDDPPPVDPSSHREFYRNFIIIRQEKEKKKEEKEKEEEETAPPRG